MGGAWHLRPNSAHSIDAPRPDRRAQAAARDPERYNLVRVRMGGWTEFYSAMFPAHQEQHQRRQYFTP
jgi:hypothetical protein